MKILICSFLLFISLVIYPQTIETPLEKNSYKKLTSYKEFMSYLKEISELDKNITLRYIAKSAEGREIPALLISNSIFNTDSSKIKVIIFAQQHGNEQSGKEGALLLIKNFVNGKLNHLLDNIDLIIVPQMNPDGSEVNERRNGNEQDLNRNHLILTQPETIGLHKLFKEFLPEVTLDVHEYYPYTKDWKKFGYIKNYDEQFGTVTNPNVSKEIFNYENDSFLPYAEKYLNQKGFSFNNYILGGPPNIERLRRSTYDINDGRQSFGILNSFSFIVEGLNGKDAYLENIKHRAEGQETAMEALLYFSFEHKNEIKKLIKQNRYNLIYPNDTSMVAIRMEHVKGKESLKMRLLSLYSNKDTVISVDNFHPDNEIILSVNKPKGYLVPDTLKKVINFLTNHGIAFSSYKEDKDYRIKRYFINKVDSTELEELMVPDPKVNVEDYKGKNLNSFIYVPINQIFGNMIVQAFEPQSMIGFVVYDEFKGLLKEKAYYPIMRVE